MLECIWFNIKQRLSFIYAFIQISSANFYNLTHRYYNLDTYLKVDFLIFERFWFCITFLKTVVELYVIASKLVQLLSSVENVFNVENCWNFFENIAFYPTNYCYDNTLNHLKYAFCFLFCGHYIFFLLNQRITRIMLSTASTKLQLDGSFKTISVKSLLCGSKNTK